LPEGYSLHAVPSDSGDDCHRNIEEVSDNRAKKFFKKQDNPAFQICNGNEAQPLTEADIKREIENYKRSLQ
jgi:hypothetical protein